MLRSKQHFQRTRRGKILKIQREHYLRDDIYCGATACAICPDSEDPLIGRRPLSSTVAACAPEHNRYLIIDTNIALHQIDLLEHPAMRNVVLLQTVLEEVKHRSMQVYARLRALSSTKERCFYVFSNEHHRATFVERRSDESPNDRNDRAIRLAARWYQDHVAPLAVPVVLLTNDAASAALAASDGIELCMTIEQYVAGRTDVPELADRLAARDAPVPGARHDEPLFPEHVSQAAALDGIRAGRYVQGTFFQDERNFNEGSVQQRDKRTVLVQSRVHINRAFNGDVVAVELLPRSQWLAPAAVITQDDADQDGAALAPGAEQVDMPGAPSRAGAEPSDVKPTGKIVAVLRRNWRPYCGHLEAPSTQHASREASLLFIPIERAIPHIRVRTRQPELLVGQRILVAVDAWDRFSAYPSGHYVRTIGAIGDKSAENEVLLLEHDIRYSDFSQAVLDCLPPNPYLISDADRAARLDLTALRICSIDPPGCTDIDDALHCRALPNGNYEVGVHIADVAHFVTSGTALDDEAALRGTTVYLVDRRIDMLPSYLGTDLCSLKANVERFAFSILWELTPDARIVTQAFHKTIIKSVHSFSYGEAQARIDSDASDELTQDIRALMRLSRALLARRIADGALTLASPEVHFDLDSETSEPLDTRIYELRATNSLVEEFMLLANCTAARKILEHYPSSAVLRRHPPPNPERFEGLLKAAALLGITLDVSSNRALQQSFDAAKSTADNPFLNQLLRILATRCMRPASYFCAGLEEDFSHYGLAAPVYTHFTSPIRRYADVLVHRQLAAAIGCMPLAASLQAKDTIKRLTDNLNVRHRNAQFAGRSSVDLHTLIFFKNRRVVEDAYIVSARTNGLVVLVPSFGIEGKILLAPEGAPCPLHFDALTQTLSVPDDPTAPRLQTFGRVRVRIQVAVNRQQRRYLDFALVEPVLAGLSMGVEYDAQDDRQRARLQDVLDAGAAAVAGAVGPSPPKRERERERDNQGGAAKKRKLVE